MRSVAKHEFALGLHVSARREVVGTFVDDGGDAALGHLEMKLQPDGAISHLKSLVGHAFTSREPEGARWQIERFTVPMKDVDALGKLKTKRAWHTRNRKPTDLLVRPRMNGPTQRAGHELGPKADPEKRFPPGDGVPHERLLGHEPWQLCLIVDTHRTAQRDDKVDAFEIGQGLTREETGERDFGVTGLEPGTDASQTFERDMLQDVGSHGSVARLSPKRARGESSREVAAVCPYPGKQGSEPAWPDCPVPLASPQDFTAMSNRRILLRRLYLSTSIAALLLAGCTINTYDRSTTVNNRTGDAKAEPGKPKPKPTKPAPKPTKPPRQPTKDPKPTKDPTPSKDPKPTTPPVKDPKPTTPVTVPSTPASATSRLVVPIRVAFSAAVAKIDKLLPKTESQGWKQVTKKGASPEIDVKYQVWRDPIEASFKAQTLTVVVPVRYAAHVRGKIKNPVGSDWLWLTRDETWGTKAEPQRMTVTVELKLTVEGDWSVKSVTHLEPLKHGPVLTGDICIKTGIQLCTTKAQIAPEVRAHIESYLVPKIEKELKKVGGELDKTLALKAQAQTLWSALQTPHALPGVTPTAWLIAKPSSLGITQLSLKDDNLGVDLSIEAKLTDAFGAKPKVKPVALPALKTLSGPSEFSVHGTFEIPTATFSQLVGKRLKGKSFAVEGSDVKVKSASLSAVGKSSDRLQVTIVTEGKGTLVLEGALKYDSKKRELGLYDLDFDDATQALLTKSLKGFDQAALRKAVGEAAVWSLASNSDALGKAVSAALNKTLPGKLEVLGELKELAIGKAEADANLIVVKIALSGSLGVKYTP